MSKLGVRNIDGYNHRVRQAEAKGEIITRTIESGFDRETGEVHYGRVPAYSVVVPGSLPGKPLPDGTPGPSLYCAVVIKRVDERTRAKTSINDLLRT